MNFNQKLEAYAKIVVNRCISLKKGEAVLIEAQIEHIDLVRLIVRECYKAGSSDVNISWEDDVIIKEKLINNQDERNYHFPDWKKKMYLDHLEKKGVYIRLSSPNLSVINDVPTERLTKYLKSRVLAIEPFGSAIRNMAIKWTIIGVPTVAWAKTVFPSLAEDEAKKKLWDMVFNFCHLDVENPMQAFDDHLDNLLKRAEKLRSKKYKQLIYQSPGTDLSVNLPKGHIWHPSCGRKDDGTVLMINYPTEEIATVPHKYGVNGRLQATLPLVYNGKVVKDFWFKFEKGMIVDYGAEEGLSVLEHIMSIDDNAKYLGEVGLVSQDTPIAQTGVLFYNTLYDENASCHFAIGAAYPATLEGAEGQELDKLNEMGFNVSKIHVDFMVGSDQLDIIGVLEDGSKEYIMKQGILL